ncbi:unnamed protein product [Amoebophrya sp. A120]|nr:unnamed protein product [Amoebophrya sp. A120]|eukprot:GSA120T00016509001.1
MSSSLSSLLGASSSTKKGQQKKTELVPKKLRKQTRFETKHEFEHSLLLQTYQSKIRFWRHVLDPDSQGRITQLEFLHKLRNRCSTKLDLNLLRLWEALLVGPSKMSRDDDTDEESVPASTADQKIDHFGDQFMYLQHFAPEGTLLLKNFLLALQIHFHGLNQQQLLEAVWKALTADKEREQIDRMFTPVNEIALGKLLASLRSLEERKLAIDQRLRRRLFLDLTRVSSLNKNHEFTSNSRQSLMFEDLRWLIFDFPKGTIMERRADINTTTGTTVFADHAMSGAGGPRAGGTGTSRGSTTSFNPRSRTSISPPTSLSLHHVAAAAEVLLEKSPQQRLKKEIYQRREGVLEKESLKLHANPSAYQEYRDVRKIQNEISRMTRGNRILEASSSIPGEADGLPLGATTGSPAVRELGNEQRLIKLKYLRHHLPILEKLVTEVRDIQQILFHHRTGRIPRELHLLEHTYLKAILDLEKEIEGEIKCLQVVD